MKTKFKILLLMVMFVVVSLAFVNGQSYANGDDDWVTYTWKQYKIKFEIPGDFKVKQNDAKKFIAGDSTMTFEIYPWKDPNVTAKDVAMQAMDDLSIDEDSGDSKVYEQDDFNGFKGYEIIGDGTQKGRDISFRVFGLIDPEGSTNFAAYVVYWADKNPEEDSEIAKELFETIEKIEK